MTRVMHQVVMAAAVVCMTAVGARAQSTQSTTTETKTFEIISVDGNQLVVRMPEGTRELTVPDDFRFTVNGQQLSVGQLKPGTKGTASITTRTTVTPVTVTEVKNGTVLQQSAGTIIVRTADGIKSFTQGDVDKRGVKMMKNGKPAQLTDFRQGNTLSATIITSKPPLVMTEKEVEAIVPTAASIGTGSTGSSRAAAGTKAPASAKSSSGAPLSSSSSASSGSAPAGGAKTLPKTASSWPALGLASALALAMGLVLSIRRRFVD